MKIRKTKFLLTFILVMILSLGFAKKVEWGEDTYWDDFMFKFQLPSHLEVSEDTKEFKNSRYFIASDNVNYTVTLYAWNGANEVNLSEKDVAQTGFDNYTSITDKNITENKTLAGTNGITFETILGDGLVGERKVFFYIAGFKIQANGSFHYCYMTFAWWDLPNENPGHKKMSTDILNKMTPLKEKREAKHEWINYSWEDYRFFFQLPGFLEVTDNELREDQSHYFVASDNVNYTIALYAWRGKPEETLSITNAADRGLADYNSITDKKIIERKQIKTAHNLNIETIYGVGTASDRKVYFLITGFLLPNGTLFDNCYMTFAWWDLPDANEKHEKLSKEILEKISLYQSKTKEDEGE